MIGAGSDSLLGFGYLLNQDRRIGLLINHFNVFKPRRYEEPPLSHQPKRYANIIELAFFQLVFPTRGEGETFLSGPKSPA